VTGGENECRVGLKRRERDYWMGTEIGVLAGYGFQSQVITGHGWDNLEKGGKMGAGITT